jgi:hypothetical protein
MPRTLPEIVRRQPKSRPGPQLGPTSKPSPPLPLCLRMLSLNLIGASFLCLQKNNHQYSPQQLLPSPAVLPNGKQEWGTVIAETTNCLFVAYPSSPEPKADLNETKAPGASVESSSPKIIFRKFIKEACIFAITSVDVVASFSGDPSTTPAHFPVCVVHGKQHLPHLLQNHSSRTFSEA